MLDAPFVAVIQIVVYAGAIMVLFLFVVMLLNAPQEDTEADERRHLLLPQRGRCGSARCSRSLLVVGAGLGADARRRVRGVPGGATELGRRDRPFAVHRLRVRVRGDLGADPRGDGRRRVLGPPRTASRRSASRCRRLNHYLLLSAVLFAIGTAGVFLRRNLITILLSIEIMLNAVNLTFVAFGRAMGSADGQIIVFFVMTVAAAEAAVGLAIVIAPVPPPRVAQPGHVHAAEMVRT